MENRVPDQFSAFQCAEYFERYREGRYDSVSQLWFIAPLDEIYTDPDHGALVIGRPGVDGLDFCYRRSLKGIWAFYPIEERWVLVAESLRELEQGWLDGSIAV